MQDGHDAPKSGEPAPTPAPNPVTGAANTADDRPVERRRRRVEGDPDNPGFLPESLDKSIIAIPLLDQLDYEEDQRARLAADGKPLPPRKRFDVIIDLNLGFKAGREAARAAVRAMIAAIPLEKGADHATEIDDQKSRLSPPQYVFARMEGPAIRELARRDNPRQEAPINTSEFATPERMAEQAPRVAGSAQRAIYRIWPDFEVHSQTTKSISTVKVDAARSSFSALGTDVVWAVIDSGIDKTHRHFALHRNLELTEPLRHFDFSVPNGTADSALTDDAGHGTHVAGIIAGEILLKLGADGRPTVQAHAATRHWNEDGAITYNSSEITAISGMAPRCKLVSMKVLDKDGRGATSSILAAIEQIQQLNGYGRSLLIQGVNLSVGYDFQPEWFACGQSPLCVEVDRLVRSGVVVVVSSGNTGYGFQTTKFEGTVAAGMNLSINDPGNAELALTVGSTHREMPHTYGVSYFSSKGPTGDGRIKPDLVAPGEKIISCAAGVVRAKAVRPGMIACEYAEQSGTSMAAPHVSGVIAAFLSIRREFIGQPMAVKTIFMSTATDLKRDRYFQGSGLVDLMRAIQSV